MEHWYIGTIGFSYKDWVGPFYPSGMQQKAFLPYYSKFFNSVELDTTFHAIPRQASIKSWLAISPGDFKFCLKTPHRITHELALKGSQSVMEEFLEVVSPLGSKLGPILIQLPPKFTNENITTLNEFIDHLPGNFQYAIEFRHISWYNMNTFDLLSKYNVGWVVIDFPRIPREINLTSNFLYVRWIGVNNLYHYHTFERIDRSEELKWWFDEIQAKAHLADRIYGYFNNDYAGFAVGTAIRFKKIAHLPDSFGNALQERFM